MTYEQHARAANAVEAIGDGLRHAAGRGVGAVLRELERADPWDLAFRQVTPSRLPACRHLPWALEICRAEVDADLAEAIEAVMGDLEWRQNPNYSDALLGPGFMENYAYAELMGRGGPICRRKFLLGLLILGPHRCYPDHHHPAPELYRVLTGGSQWRQGDEPWRIVAPGATVWHEPRVVHAIRTGGEPLLAVYAWTRNVHEPARLVARA